MNLKQNLLLNVFFKLYIFFFYFFLSVRAILATRSTIARRHTKKTFKFLRALCAANRFRHRAASRRIWPSANISTSTANQTKRKFSPTNVRTKTARKKSSFPSSAPCAVTTIACDIVTLPITNVIRQMHDVIC